MRLREYWLRFKRYVLPYPLGFIGKYMMKAIFKTCKIEISGLHHLENLGNKTILAVWHNRISIICEFFHNYLPKQCYAAFLSNSRDGEPIAHVLKRYPGTHSIRVVHSMRHHALHEAVDYLNHKRGVLVVTPDGPKGPRYQVKPGIVYAAQESGAGVLAFTWECDKFWEFKTWDQFRIPKPFAKLKIHISAPLHVGKSVDREAGKQLVQNLLNSVSP